MAPRIRIIPHAGIDKDCGSFEVRVSVYFHWEDNPGRRLRPEQMTQDQAKEAAQKLAREEQEKLK